MEQFERTELLIGKENLNKLASKNVIVFGVGGVGGYVCEMLVRTGIEKITIVDFDTVAVSNINRQIIALNSTVGKSKVDVMKARLLDINPNCNVTVVKEKLLAENILDFKLENFDYVADCIDMKNSKVALIEYCYNNNINIISAMGAGNKFGIPNFVIKDIFKTSYDGLAKVLRRKLKQVGVKHHNVVVCEQQSKDLVPVGSIVFYPAMCGCLMASKIINDLVNY